ncbi:Mmp37-domain-containing protein [Infundibulicybe gibba]|nr:Mmp37-domain-containing protein [Infundibulicybe gibba]
MLAARHRLPVVLSSSSRTLATHTFQSQPSDIPPPSPPPNPKRNVQLHPRPRPTPSTQPSSSALPKLPSSFGRNQLLPVSNSTRALLESIVAQFNAPVRYAFAYGSGVFEQDGYEQQKPMLDFMFAVTHPAHFHSINMQQHPSHYPLHARLLGSSYISHLQGLGPGVWFNAYIPIGDVMIKYGVTTVDNLCTDLLSWRTLYLAGRMHKPIRIIKDDARVRLTQQVNLTSALRAALLTLPPSFSPDTLYTRIAGISYAGDPRMLLPAENRGKVASIVARQAPHFADLYRRLALGLPSVHWPLDGPVTQDNAPAARVKHIKKLPAHLLQGVRDNYARRGELDGLFQRDEAAYWMRLAADERLPDVIQQEMARIVRYPATVQSLKGLASAGLGKSLRYSSAKVSKWWAGGKSV